MSGLAGVLAGAHALAAMRTGHAHWQLNEPDAKRYAIAIANVLRYYSVKASQKAIDHAALLFIVAEIESPRFALSAMLNKHAATPTATPGGAQGGATVFKFNNPNAAATAPQDAGHQ